MLNAFQKMTIRVAIQRARENGTEAEEIRKLSVGMKTSEAEIRAYAAEALDSPSVADQQPNTPARQAHGKRLVWTEEMVAQLLDLHCQGMGPTKIAGRMGLDAKAVSMKLSRVKDKKPESKPHSTPAAIQKAIPPAATSTPPKMPDAIPENKSEPTGQGLNMTGVLPALMNLVTDHFDAKICRVYASNNEIQAACAFEKDGHSYNLKLEEIK